MRAHSPDSALMNKLTVAQLFENAVTKYVRVLMSDFIRTEELTAVSRRHVRPDAAARKGKEKRK